MKRTIALIFAMAMSLGMLAQEKEEKVPNGWNFGPLPCISYDSGLGLQYGICADIFNYKGVYPDYRQRFYVEVSRYYPSAQTLVHAQFDSKYLIPGIRTTFSASFQYDPLFQFYGFNGIESYNPVLWANKSTRINRYAYQRSMVRVLADFQGPIAKNLNWAAGLSYWYYKTSDINMKEYDADKTLYREMVQEGVISRKELGGHRLEIKAGLVFDTRDNEAAPNKGIWAETYLNGSPSITGDGYNYLRLAAHFRHYISLWPDRVVFAYHIGYQGTFGKAPFYTMQNISTLYLRQTCTDGIGGMNTVRGLLPQRVVGNGYAWLNAEIRVRIVSFRFIGQNWYLAVNPLFDAGIVTDPAKLEELSVFYAKSVEDLRKDSMLPHMSAGGGIKLAMNQNFIVSAEVAMPLNAFTFSNGKRQTDGTDPGLYIVLNYIF